MTSAGNIVIFFERTYYTAVADKFPQFMYRPCQHFEYLHLLYRGICYAQSAVTDDRNAPIKRARRATETDGTVPAQPARKNEFTDFRCRFDDDSQRRERERRIEVVSRHSRKEETRRDIGTAASNRIVTSATPEKCARALHGAHGSEATTVAGGSTRTSS